MRSIKSTSRERSRVWTETSLIEIKGLSKEYADVVPLKDENVNIAGKAR